MEKSTVFGLIFRSDGRHFVLKTVDFIQNMFY